MKFHKLCILFFLPFIVLCCNGANKPKEEVHNLVKKHTNDVFVTEFEKYVTETMAQSHMPGAAVAIVSDTSIILLKGYGVKTFGSHDSVDVHTVFRIASVSKGFASMLAGILVQENLIAWDDKVIKYLPDFKLKDETSTHQLTIRNILSHTSGLPVHTFSNMIEEGIPFATLEYNLRTVNMAAPVGKEFAYQNVIFSLISDIALKATGKTYAELLHEKIFKPLGMNDASDSFEDLVTAKNVAMPHLRRDSTKYLLIHNTQAYYSVLPAAGVNASISDMAQWLKALLGERPDVIKKSILQEMYKPEIVTPRRSKYEFFRWNQLKKASYGLGWRVLNYGGDTVIYHGGHVNGYRSEVAFSPSDKVGIVILTNSTGKLPNDGVEIFFDAYLAFKKSMILVKK